MHKHATHQAITPNANAENDNWKEGCGQMLSGISSKYSNDTILRQKSERSPTLACSRERGRRRKIELPGDLKQLLLWDDDSRVSHGALTLEVVQRPIMSEGFKERERERGKCFELRRMLKKKSQMKCHRAGDPLVPCHRAMVSEQEYRPGVRRLTQHGNYGGKQDAITSSRMLSLFANHTNYIEIMHHLSLHGKTFLPVSKFGEKVKVKRC